MAKFELKIRAREMREGGSSVLSISKLLQVSKGTVSLWCRDIVLSEEQICVLHANSVSGRYRGSIKGAQVQRERRLQRIIKFEESGLEAVGTLSKRELLLIGLGLHLGEGSKTGTRVRFTNSNPAIVKIFLAWIEDVFNVPRSEMACRVMINSVHRYRELEVKEGWSKILGIPTVKFQKTTFIKAKTKKVYKNHDNFLGTLALTVPKSSELQYRILGLMKGLVYKICEEVPA